MFRYMKMKKLLWILILVSMRLNSMELQENRVEDMLEEPRKSHVLSLKHLSARAYAEKYKKLPKKAIPEECIPYLKLYLPITSESVDEQFALALELDNEKRIKECREKFLKCNSCWVPRSLFIFRDEKRNRKDYQEAKIIKYLKNSNVENYNEAFNLLHKETLIQIHTEKDRFTLCYAGTSIAIAFMVGIVLPSLSLYGKISQ